MIDKNMMQWVNASDRLPKNYGLYFCIDVYGHKRILSFNGNRTCQLVSNPKRYKWLDENINKT